MRSSGSGVGESKADTVAKKGVEAGRFPSRLKLLVTVEFAYQKREGATGLCPGK
jgi:hypothetical protein